MRSYGRSREPCPSPHVMTMAERTWTPSDARRFSLVILPLCSGTDSREASMPSDCIASASLLFLSPFQSTASIHLSICSRERPNTPAMPPQVECCLRDLHPRLDRWTFSRTLEPCLEIRKASVARPDGMPIVPGKKTDLDMGPFVHALDPSEAIRVDPVPDLNQP